MGISEDRDSIRAAAFHLRGRSGDFVLARSTYRRHSRTGERHGASCAILYVMAKPLAPLSWTPSLPRSQWSTAPRFARRIVTPPGFRGSDGQIRSRRTGDLGPGGKSLQRWLDNQKRRGGTLDCTLELIVLADDGRTVGSDATGSIDPVGAGYVAPGRRRFADDCSSVRSDTPRPVHAVGTSGGIGRLGESRRPRKGHQRERSVFHWRFSRRFRNRDETDTGRGRPATRFFRHSRYRVTA